MNLDELDGRIGEGWGGEAPNGSHVNVVLARRGSATAAAAVSMLAHPAPGHTPVLVCVGPTQAEYEPVWPPTLMMNKATAVDDRHQVITWGAAQLGIGQGVLDAVADGVIDPPLARADQRLAYARHQHDRERCHIARPNLDPVRGAVPNLLVDHLELETRDVHHQVAIA